MAVFQCQLVVDESGGGTFSCIRVDISPTTYLMFFLHTGFVSILWQVDK